MRTQKHRLLFLVVWVAIFALSGAGCGLTSDWSFSVNAPSGSISANGKSTNTSLFDTWTLKVMAAPMACAAIQEGVMGAIETYRMTETSLGCAVSTTALDGTTLTSNPKLFDGESDCLVDTDSIDLERHFKVSLQASPDCTNTGTYMAHLSRGEDNTTLTGEITGSITYSGNCTVSGQPLADCDFKAPLVATRGTSSSQTGW